MPRGYRNFVLTALGWLILTGQAKQQGRAEQHHYEQATAKPVLIPKSTDAPNTKRSEYHCYPGSEPDISCDGIAAKAAVDQARDADKEASSLPWQTGMGIGTLLAAIAAALFAWFAVKETRRIGEAQTRAYLSIVNLCGFHTENGISLVIEVSNAGQSPALEVMAKCEIVDGAGALITLLHDASDYVASSSSKELAHIYYRNNGSRSWNGIAVRVTIAYVDVFENISDISERYVGAPSDWSREDGTRLVPSQHVVSILGSGLIPDAEDQR